MSDDLRPSAESPDPTDVRLSIKSLLIVMAAVALLAAALGPYFRTIPAAVLPQVATLWAACIFFVACWLGFHGRKRFCLEREAGKKLLDLSPFNSIFGRRSRWAPFVGGNLMIVLTVFNLILSGREFQRPGAGATTMLAGLYNGLLCGMLIAVGLSLIWWNRTVQLRSSGVLYGLRMLRWTHVTDCRWDAESILLEGVDQRQWDFRVGMFVPDCQRDAVAQVVSERIRAPSGSTSSAAASPPKRVAVPMTSVMQRFTRGLIVFAVCVASGVFGTLQALYRPVPHGFFYGWYAGLLAIGAAGLFLARRVRQAGPPHVRFRARLDWQTLLGSVAVTAACYSLASCLAFNDVWLGAMLGIPCGMATSLAIAVSASRRCDLCEHGAILRGRAFWPWSAVRIDLWDRESSGRLELRNGWRRSVVEVPPEQRAAVDAILREKLGQFQ
jgi:hypothetical protein